MPQAMHGIGVSSGIAIGKVRILHHGQVDILEYTITPAQVAGEIARFRVALGQAQAQLRNLRQRIPESTPADIATFIDTHLLMLEDAPLAREPEELIRSQLCNAEWALKLQQDALVKVFEAMDDPYLRTRRDDVEHVVRRVLHLLLNKGGSDHASEDEEPRIILAVDISPSDLVQLHHHHIAALVTERGGPLSHTAILARALGIPAIVGVPRIHQYLLDDELVVVDGRRGALLGGLDSAELEFYRKRQRAEQKARNELRKLKDTPSVTLDGVAINLQANIELPEDIAAMRKAGASGVGLYRTEFLFMNRPTPPGEEEQYQAYRQMVKRLNGAPLTIRTLDLGADKEMIPGQANCRNPALGLRAIRLCLKEPELFRPQLRAILRASAHGPVKLLIPMLTSIAELQPVRQILEEVRAELRAQNHRFDAQLPIGAMIEVPAAALCADSFARELDFLSIGTNDLIQYTLATDRIDETVNHLYDPLNLAVLRLIRDTIRAGSEACIPVSLCGEMASDPTYTRLLLGMGLTDFSMPPAALLQVKHIVTTSTLKPLRKQVERLLRSHHAEQIAAGLEQLNRP
ncbi:MAG TPA: phosphoenolpyruvate--protein phosphotransferase [Gammaproteobacteria bacterium]